jgi:hypothetical protein
MISRRGFAQMADLTAAGAPVAACSSLTLPIMAALC